MPKATGRVGVLLLTVGTGDENRREETLYRPLRLSIGDGNWLKVILLPSHVTEGWAKDVQHALAPLLIEIFPLPKGGDEDDADRCFDHFDRVLATLKGEGVTADQVEIDPTNLIGGHVEARGLDPAMGFLHTPRPGRASLALDLLEEFRHPVVDRFVMRVCNLRMLQPGMFEIDPEEGGVRLTREGLKIFFKAWGEYLERPVQEVGGEKLSPAVLIRRQVNRMAMAFRGEEVYQPFLLQD